MLWEPSDASVGGGRPLLVPEPSLINWGTVVTTVITATIVTIMVNAPIILWVQPWVARRMKRLEETAVKQAKQQERVRCARCGKGVPPWCISTARSAPPRAICVHPSAQYAGESLCKMCAGLAVVEYQEGESESEFWLRGDTARREATTAMNAQIVVCSDCSRQIALGESYSRQITRIEGGRRWSFPGRLCAACVEKENNA